MKPGEKVMEKHSFRWLFLIFLAAWVTGCAGAEPFEYHPDTEVKQGPGLFSGEKGSFQILGQPAEKKK